MEKLTDQDALSAETTNDDLIHMVDVSDTSEDPAGTSKKVKRSQFATQTFPDASARATAVPGFIGQFGVQLDEVDIGGGIYISDGVTAGDWVPIDGEWTDVAFNASDYEGATGTWTVEAGDVSVNRYKVIGKILYWTVVLISTVTSGTPASLLIDIPNGYTAKKQSEGYLRVRIGGVNSLQFVVTAAGSGQIDLQTLAGGFADGTYQNLSFNIAFEIE